MLSIFFLCLLSILFSIQGSTLLLNTTKIETLGKFSRNVFVKVPDNPHVKVLASALLSSSYIGKIKISLTSYFCD